MEENNNPYDISNYTDKELLEILDLNNPSDRELEAKIISNINKYSQIKNKEARQISIFYKDIYDHFFDDDDEDEDGDEEKYNVNHNIVEGFESFPTPTTRPTPSTSTTPSKSTLITIGSGSKYLPPPIYEMDPSYNKMADMKGNVILSSTPANANVNASFTTQLEYRKDIINPILKQTIKRVISIDSQYRDIENYPLTTDFTFNLSETLKDVLSLKLYSIQIPYSWYTINNYYGSSFFYIYGNVAGNSNDNYIFDISSGTYDQNQIIEKIQESIDNVKKRNLDVSFGNTSITCHPNTSKVTLIADIRKKYNYEEYELIFPNTTSPFSHPRDSISGYLGFGNSYYNPKSIYSKKDILPPYNFSTNIENDGVDTKYNFTNTTLNPNFDNNYITIQQLDPQGNIQNEIQIDFPIATTTTATTATTTITQGYTRTELTNYINSILSKSPYLETEESNIKRYNIIWNSNDEIIYQDQEGFIKSQPQDSCGNYIYSLNGISITDLPEISTNSQCMDLSNNSEYLYTDTSNNRYYKLTNPDLIIQSYFQFQLKLNRNCTTPDKNGNTIRWDISSSTIHVLFPSETSTKPIWTGTNSCFQFDTNYNYIPNYYRYGVSGASIKIQLNNSNYLNGNNNYPQYDVSYIIPIPNSPSIQYTHDEYLSIIQAGFQNINDCSATTVNQSSSALLIALNINKTYTTKSYDVSMSSNGFQTIFPTTTTYPSVNGTIGGNITINGNVSYSGGKYTNNNGIVNDEIYGNVILHDTKKIYMMDDLGNLVLNPLNNQFQDDIYKMDPSYIIQTINPNVSSGSPTSLGYIYDLSYNRIIDSRIINYKYTAPASSKVKNYIYLIPDNSNTILNTEVYEYDKTRKKLYKSQPQSRSEVKSTLIYTSDSCGNLYAMDNNNNIYNINNPNNQVYKKYNQAYIIDSNFNVVSITNTSLLFIANQTDPSNRYWDNSGNQYTYTCIFYKDDSQPPTLRNFKTDREINIINSFISEKVSENVSNQILNISNMIINGIDTETGHFLDISGNIIPTLNFYTSDVSGLLHYSTIPSNPITIIPYTTGYIGNSNGSLITNPNPNLNPNSYYFIDKSTGYSINNNNELYSYDTSSIITSDYGYTFNPLSNKPSHFITYLASIRDASYTLFEKYGYVIDISDSSTEIMDTSYIYFLDKYHQFLDINGNRLGEFSQYGRNYVPIKVMKERKIIDSSYISLVDTSYNKITIHNTIVDISYQDIDSSYNYIIPDNSSPVYKYGFLKDLSGGYKIDSSYGYITSSSSTSQKGYIFTPLQSHLPTDTLLSYGYLTDASMNVIDSSYGYMLDSSFLFFIKPNGTDTNSNAYPFIVPYLYQYVSFADIKSFQYSINHSLSSYIDPYGYGDSPIGIPTDCSYNLYISSPSASNTIPYRLSITINKQLQTNDFLVNFIDTGTTNIISGVNSWSNYFGINANYALNANYVMANNTINITGQIPFLDDKNTPYKQLSSIVSESKIQNSNYEISGNYILFDVISYPNSNGTQQYKIVDNRIDITSNIPNTPYTSSQYLSTINKCLANSPYTKYSSLSIVNQNAQTKSSLKLNIEKIFTTQMYSIIPSREFGVNLLNQSIFKRYWNEKDQGYSFPPIQLLTNVFTGTFKINGSNGYLLPENLFEITPTKNNNNSDVYGNMNALPFNVKNTSYDSINNIKNIYYKLNKLENAINKIFQSYIDPSTTSNSSYKNPLNNTNIKITDNGDGNASYILTISVNKVLLTNDFKVSFIDSDSKGDYSWKEFLGIDTSYNLSDVTKHPLQPEFPYMTIQNLMVITSKIRISPPNNRFGLHSMKLDETLWFVIQKNVDNTYYYSTDDLIDKINSLFKENPVTNGSTISIYTDPITNIQYSSINLNINKIYSTKDYVLNFYDSTKFTSCSNTLSNNQMTTWDTTLGWLLGYRINPIYNLNNHMTSVDNVASITGDSVITTNLYNYFMIILDDFNQSHLNDGLITTVQKENDIPLPSYATRMGYVCNPITKKLSPANISVTGGNNLTQNQIYAAQEIINSKSNRSVYSSGVFAKDLFALIPIKPGAFNSTYVEFGGTLQNQERMYFGPVNIHRLRVQLINDKGQTIDLNGSNWGFSFICESLYQQNST